MGVFLYAISGPHLQEYQLEFWGNFPSGGALNISYFLELQAYLNIIFLPIPLDQIQTFLTEALGLRFKLLALEKVRSINNFQDPFPPAVPKNKPPFIFEVMFLMGIYIP